MSVTLNITESQALTSLRTFLLSVLPSGIEIVRGQNNRVAMPDVDDFIVMQPILRERLSTNFVAYSDGMTLHPPTTVESGFYLTPTALTVQLDVYGPASGARRLRCLCDASGGIAHRAALHFRSTAGAVAERRGAIRGPLVRRRYIPIQPGRYDHPGLR
jgi:hypothetical protein